MRKIIFALMLSVLLAVSSLALVIPAKANPSATIVVPDDYPTIASAVADADNGDSIYVKSGTYNESSLVINKSISLIGENASSTILNLESPRHSEEMNIMYYMVWYDPAMTVNCNNFKLSNFTIYTTGGPIKINGTGTSITNNTINAELSVTGSNQRIINNKFSSSTNGISFNGEFCTFSQNQVTGKMYANGKNNIVSSNDVNAEMYLSLNDSLIQKNNIHDTSGFFTISGNGNIISKNIINNYAIGLRLKGSNNTVLLNQITRCGMAISPGVGNIFFGNYFSKNAWILNNGETIQGGNQSVLVHNNFVDNYNYKLEIPLASSERSVFDDGKEGNYWSDYTGADSNGDGIGDTPYNLDSAHSDRYPLMNPFDLSSVKEIVLDWLVYPNVQLNNPQNTSYTNADVPVDFVVNQEAVWVGYSLDGQDTVTMTENITLTDLPLGSHNLTVYATDVFGNLDTSETILFTIGSPSDFPIVPLSLGVTLVIVCIGIILYKRKKKR